MGWSWSFVVGWCSGHGRRVRLWSSRGQGTIEVVFLDNESTLYSSDRKTFCRDISSMFEIKIRIGQSICLFKQKCLPIAMEQWSPMAQPDGFKSRTGSAIVLYIEICTIGSIRSEIPNQKVEVLS